jgi:hypothetical protein
MDRLIRKKRKLKKRKKFTSTIKLKSVTSLTKSTRSPRRKSKPKLKRGKKLKRFKKKMKPIQPNAIPETQSEEQQKLVQTNDSDAYNRGYQEGFKKGHYAGGDGLVDQLLPEATILPGIPLDQIISTGIGQMHANFHPIMGTDEVVGLIISALNEKKSLSLIRLGDGELLTMAQEILKSTDQVLEEGPFLNYAGIQIPNLEVRNQLVEAVRGATVVGIPLLRMPNFQPLAFSVFRVYGLDFHQLNLTHSTINYAIYLEHCLSKIVTGRRVLMVGNKAGPMAEIFTANGIAVVGAVSPVQGIHDIPRVMAEVAAQDFDIALVSAGVPAVVIVHKIASELGKVAIDFGHLADSMVKGEAPFA